MLRYGASTGESGSEARYLRVNLRGLRSPAARPGVATLWPLVPLAREGASDEAVRKASEAIDARSELSAPVQGQSPGGAMVHRRGGGRSRAADAGVY